MSESQGKKNTGLYAIVGVLVVVAVGALVFLSGNMGDKENNSQRNTIVAEASEGQTETQNSQTAAAENEPAAGTAEADVTEEAERLEIKPGNPTVAVVNGEEIKRSDVFSFIANLPENVRQLPVQQLFKMSLEQLVNAKLVEKRATQANLESNEQVQEQLEQAKEQIMRTVFLQQQVDERITEESLQELYQAYTEQIGETPERKARHILVEDKATAEKLIKEAKGGADFEELAREHSTGPSAAEGGDLGWFAKNEMVAEFANAAFNIEPGNVGDEPVETQFGWHVVKVEDARTRQPPSFEEAKPMIESQLRRQVLDQMVNEWREEAEIEVYNINGEEIAEAEAETSGEAATETSAN